MFKHRLTAYQICAYFYHFSIIFDYFCSFWIWAFICIIGLLVLP
nr:MAG TPA: hypothetical protein [Caudoviricetes sp.]